MSKIGLFYGSETGNTRKVAKSIVKKLGDDAVELFNVTKATPDDFAKFSSIILATPTLGDGELVNSWKEFFPTFQGIDLTGKTVAIYGFGDQDAYGHEFCDAMIILYNAAKAQGATIIGSWGTDGYEFHQVQVDCGWKVRGPRPRQRQPEGRDRRAPRRLARRNQVRIAGLMNAPAHVANATIGGRGVRHATGRGRP